MSDPAWVLIPASGGAWHIPRGDVRGFAGIKGYQVWCIGRQYSGHISAYATVRSDGLGLPVPGCDGCMERWRNPSKAPEHSPPPLLCQVAGCDHPNKTHYRGLCWGHYKRWQKTGNVGRPGLKKWTRRA